MALIFFDGFESYATADITKVWTSQTGTVAILPTSGRRGGGCLAAPNASGGGGFVNMTLSSAVSTIFIGFAFIPSALNTTASVTIARLLDAGTLQNEIRMNPDGTMSVLRNGIVLGTSTNSVVVDGSNFIEYRTTIHDTAGSFELRLNGITILSASGVDTKNTVNASVNVVSIGASTSTGGTLTWLYDDLYVLDSSGSSNNNFLGDIRVDAVYPTADGNYKQWTPSTGTDHYLLVDETSPNTTDYVTDGTVGNKDSYTLSDPPALVSQVIYGVKVSVAAHKDDTGSRSVKIGVRSAGVDNLGSVQPLSTSQVRYRNIHDVDPATGTAWTPAAVNTLEALIETA